MECVSLLHWGAFIIGFCFGKPEAPMDKCIDKDAFKIYILNDILNYNSSSLSERSGLACRSETDLPEADRDPVRGAAGRDPLPGGLCVLMRGIRFQLLYVSAFRHRSDNDALGKIV
jgi:hypothetical protein